MEEAERLSRCYLGNGLDVDSFYKVIDRIINSFPKFRSRIIFSSSAAEALRKASDQANKLRTSMFLWKYLFVSSRLMTS